MSTPATYRKRPVVIEAMRWTGDNYADVIKFLGEDHFAGADRGPGFDRVHIATLEGPITASLGDWIIRGVQGEFYQCKPDIFEATYGEQPPTFDPESLREMASRLLTAANEAEAAR